MRTYSNDDPVQYNQSAINHQPADTFQLDDNSDWEVVREFSDNTPYFEE